MPDQSLTHKDLATLAGVSETTIKSYRRKFADCIPVASRGKPIRFTPEAGQVCLRIRDLFAEGMSVPEARARLAEEFSWISIVAREKKQPESSVALPHEFTMGISNLAKSMVTLTQQQGGILKRLQELEESVSAIPASPSAAYLAEGGTQEAARTAPGGEGAAFHTGGIVPAELLHVKESLENLAAIEPLTAALHQATNALTGAAEALNEAAGRLALAEATFLEQTSRRAESESPGAEQSQSRVVRFPGVQRSGAHSPGKDQQPPPPPASPASVAPDQVPRHLFSLPLVFRTQDGTFMPAGGRARGPFSLNDLKAILAHAKLPPEHYVMQWRRAAGGWWLIVEQPQAAEPRSVHILLRELASQRGMSVAEIAQVVNGGVTAPVTFFGVFVDSLTGDPA